MDGNGRVLTSRQAASPTGYRVVVLGSRGFVGGEVVRHLEAAGTSTIPVSAADVDLLAPGSVDTLQQVVRPEDVVVMTAAITPDRGRDSTTLMKNLTMGYHVGTLVSHIKCAQMVYVSSDAVYEDTEAPICETSRCTPASLHGLMHLVRERMMAQMLEGSGVPLAILRPSLLYGAGDSHNGYGPNRFVRSALREGTVTLFGEGEERRDHVYIEDVARLLGLAIAHRSEGVMNVATGMSVSFREVADIVAELSPHPVRIGRAPRTTAVTHRSFDVEVTRQAFPSFRFTSLREGLAKTITGMREAAGG